MRVVSARGGATVAVLIEAADGGGEVQGLREGTREPERPPLYRFKAHWPRGWVRLRG